MAEDFDILYRIADAQGRGEGGDSRQMTTNDLRWFVNRARCECGQQIWTRIRLNNVQIDENFIGAFVGSRCAEGQLGNNVQAKPCVRLLEATPGQFSNPPFEATFSPIWLASGVALGSPQDIAAAEPFFSCDFGQGTNTGVWICAENGQEAQCQPEEFIITGTQNINSPEDDPIGIAYDFVGPIINAPGDLAFEVEPGDGALRVSWDIPVNDDIHGFRILCSDVEGNPVPDTGFTLRSETAPNEGLIYYTASNLCPEGPFGPNPEGDGTPTSEPPVPGGIPDEGTGSGTSGMNTSGGVVEPPPDAWSAEPRVSRTDQCCSPQPQGNCNQSSNAEDIACANLVRAELPECAAEWTEDCAERASQLCLSCGSAGACCVPNPTPGCYDQACMQDVCMDELVACCDVGGAWSPSCADRARETCNVCAMEGDSGDLGTTSGGGDTTAGAETEGTDTEGAGSQPILSLDWDYVCSGHLALGTTSARIGGLENGRTYNILVVAYDRQGNPTVASSVLEGVPQETIDFWEQCELQGGICGDGGFCSCSSERNDSGGPLVFTALFMAAGLGYRRRPATTRRGPGRHGRAMDAEVPLEHCPSAVATRAHETAGVTP